MEQHPHQGGDPDRLPESPRWPKYIGAAALDAWLARVAEHCDQEPSIELYIAQYPGGEGEQTQSEEATRAKPIQSGPMQLPLPLQWGNEQIPVDLCGQPLRPADAEATQRILATAVNIFAGRTALFALYDRLEPKTYAALATRLRTSMRLPASAELRSVHGQYVARDVIEAFGTARAGPMARALAARLERKRRRWMGTELRLV